MIDAVKIDKLIVRANGSKERFVMTICEPYVNEHGDWETLVSCPCVQALDAPRRARGNTREQVIALALRMVVLCHGREPELVDDEGSPFPFPRPEDYDPTWLEIDSQYRSL